VLPAAGRAAGPADVAALAELAGAGRGLVVAGWGAGVDPAQLAAFTAATGWPVLADPLSDLRAGPLAVSTYDALLRSPGFAAAHRPDVVVRLGAQPTSRAVLAWLDSAVPQVMLGPAGSWADPGLAASMRLAGDPGALLAAVAERLGPRQPGPWAAAWLDAEATARRTIDELLDGWQEPFEGRVARDLSAALPDGAVLVAGASMPVRDLEQFARPRDGLRHHGNRGLSGIDGFVATALGIAAAGPGPVAALCGDLTFLHDAGTVLAASRLGPGVVFVVVDNDGGGIFSLLPQAGLPAHFETLFGTPHGLDLGALCDAARLPWRRIAKAGELVPAVTEALAAGGSRVVLVPGERAANARRHREVTDAVAEALAARPLR
jgi:2-succinyl-5-enolpyruvyl-6-hydroxy-3-cyclohexene-1-carboxylate synthase